MRMNKGALKAAATAGFMALLLSLALPAMAIELTFVTHEYNQLNPAVTLFNEKMEREGRDLRVQLIDGKIDKIQVMIAGGTPPDLIEIDLVHGPSLMAQGVMLNLDPIIERDNYGSFVEGLIPGMMTLSRYQGSTYFLPLWADNSMLYYSITKLEQSGLPGDPPKTWDELVEMARRTTFPERDMYGYERMPALFWFTFMPYLWGNGGDLVSADGTTVTINSTEAAEAIQLWHDLRNVYEVTRPEGGAREDFRGGLDTFFVQGGDKVGGIRSHNPDLKWDVTPVPTRVEGQQPSSFIGGGTFGIVSMTNYPDEAWEVMKFLLSDEVQIEVVAEEMGTPVHRDYLNNPYFREEPAHLKFAQAAFLPNARTPYTPAFAELGGVVAPFEQAVRGEIPVAEALLRMEQVAQTALSKVGIGPL